ncbi:MAG: DUF5606 domain-containing protein [Spirosomataceae bacterium]
MELLREVANISGKPGLYRIVKPTRTGVIVETLDAKKEKTVVGGNAKVSVLKDISVYLNDRQDSAKPLAEIFEAIHQLHGTAIALDAKTASNSELFDFLGGVEPNFDRERVYPSDIRKMIVWYNIVAHNLPEAFVKSEEPASEATPVSQ